MDGFTHAELVPNALFLQTPFLTRNSLDSPESSSSPTDSEPWRAWPIFPDFGRHNTHHLSPPECNYSWNTTTPGLETWIPVHNTAQDLRMIQLGELNESSSGIDRDYEDFFSTASESPPCDTSVSRDYRCNWPSCLKLEISTAEDDKLHRKAHAQGVRTRWQPFEKCSWHECPSQARFKTSKNLEDHISNIHINPLLCTRDGCTHTSPFRGKADLQRHIDSVHGNTPKLRCPFPWCPSRDEKTYSRKDKLINHLRRVHDTDPCPFDHCASAMFSSPEAGDSMAKHIGKMHGDYECSLQSCCGSKSQFLEESFMAHLQLHHNLQWELVLKTRDAVKKSEGRVLKDGHLLGHLAASDCTSCPKTWRE